MDRHLTMVAALSLVGVACSSTPPHIDGRDGRPADRSLTEARVDQLPLDATVDARRDTTPACPLGATSCIDAQQQRVCKEVAGQLQPGWVTEACPVGTRCLEQRCSADCTDQCNLGEQRSVGGKNEECKLYSVATDAPLPLTQGMHDRARRYNAWLRAWHLPAGTVGDAIFTDTTYQKVAAWDGTGDSAIWTGSYLAAEALRLKVTGSPDAEANVERLVEAVHRLFAVTGHPGFLARYTAPYPSGDSRIDAQFDLKEPTHHKTTYLGKDYAWKGSTSRDQYQGPLLGYALAYEVLSSAKHKQLIRDDMISLAQELIKERNGVLLTVRFNVNGTWIELPLSTTMRHVVLNPSEYKNGGVFIQVGTDSNPTDFEGSQIYGLREFLPDFATVLKQIPLLGPLIPSIPRAGSAIMLASILRIALLVTKNDPAYAATYAAIKDHYDNNIGGWLGIMKQYLFLNASPPQCWKSYYGLNIDFEPVYNLVRLEEDATLRASLQQDVLAGKMWPIVQDHKNVFFSFIHASQAPSSPMVQGIITAAVKQLGQFPPPPHAQVAVDNTAKYPANPSCAGQSSVAVDVGDRTASDFIWQRDPFSLKATAYPTLVYPGADYLLAYWMGRRHGFLADDGAGTCLRWQ